MNKIKNIKGCAKEFPSPIYYSVDGVLGILLLLVQIAYLVKNSVALTKFPLYNLKCLLLLLQLCQQITLEYMYMWVTTANLLYILFTLNSR